MAELGSEKIEIARAGCSHSSYWLLSTEAPVHSLYIFGKHYCTFWGLDSAPARHEAGSIRGSTFRSQCNGPDIFIDVGGITQPYQHDVAVVSCGVIIRVWEFLCRRDALLRPFVGSQAVISHSCVDVSAAQEGIFKHEKLGNWID